MRKSSLLTALAVASCCPAVVSQIHASHQVIIATNVGANDGVLSVVETASPFPVDPAAAASSRDAIVHEFGGALYVLGRESREVQIRELPSLKLRANFSIRQVSAPRDLLMVDSRMALISDYDSKHLWWLDTATGDLTVGQDLSPYADPDTLPDLSMMIAVGQRVYVQMQCFDRNTYTSHGAKLAVLAPGFSPTPPVILENVIDLQGVKPDFRMQVNDAGDRLFVCAPGVDNDWGGTDTGIEEIDLNAQQSIGFVIRETDFGADLGSFVMIDDRKGFAIAHTSIVASTHLRVFDRGGQIAELNVVFGRLESIAYDRVRRQIIFPVPQGGMSGGVLIYSADTHQQSSGLIPIGGDPFDMIVVQ